MFKQLIAKIARTVYGMPFVGIRVRGIVEKFLGQRNYQDRAYWNESLKGWASSYLGGTLAIDLRNSMTVLLAKQVAPAAKSVLDLGCAGGTLALCLGPEFDTYCGVDISDVAIANAMELLDGPGGNPAITHQLEVSTVQDFQPSRQFDVIIFNEVMYYLPLAQIADAARRYSRYLSPDGVILVSLKDQQQCRCVLTVLLQELEFLHGIVYQQVCGRPDWKIAFSREAPGFLINAFKTKKN